MKIIIFLSIALLANCNDFEINEKNIADIFNAQLKNFYNIKNIEELKKSHTQVKSILENLEQKSLYRSDFEYLDRLHKFRNYALAKEFDNTKLVFKYLLTRDQEKLREKFIKEHQKSAPNCLIFNSATDRKKLEEAYRLLKQEEFNYEGKLYKFSDAIKKWQSIKGYENDEATINAFARQFKEGICAGLERVSNLLFCEHKSMNDDDFASLLQKNGSVNKSV